jgi:hypothetical protein
VTRIYERRPRCYRIRLAPAEEAQLSRYSVKLNVSVPTLIRAIVHDVLLRADDTGVRLEFGGLELRSNSRRDQ